MELIFNELSETPLCYDKTNAYERVEKFIATFKAASQFGFNIIRCQNGIYPIKLTSDYSLHDYCNEPKHSRTRGAFLRGIIRTPYIADDSEEGRYVENIFILQKGKETIEPYGLAVSYLHSVPAIGFLSEGFWEDCIFNLKIYPLENIEKVYCLSKEEHIEDNQIISFIQNMLPVQLIETDILPNDKKWKLRNDHGIKVLEAFTESILQSKFVLSVINSLPYNPYERNFIRKIYPDGKIEIVLTRTDEGLGVVIQTTGRNIRETKKIAEFIELKFNKE
jgi:hypothetical protein